MMRAAISIGAVVISTTVLCAQNVDAIKQRQQVMKNILEAGGRNIKMHKGEAPFDLATVQAGLATYQSEAAKLKGLFPENSKSPNAEDTIWQNKAGFEAAIDAFIKTAKDKAAVMKDEASFKSEYPSVVQSCNGCHKESGGFAPRIGDILKKKQSGG